MRVTRKAGAVVLLAVAVVAVVLALTLSGGRSKGNRAPAVITAVTTTVGSATSSTATGTPPRVAGATCMKMTAPTSPADHLTFSQTGNEALVDAVGPTCLIVRFTGGPRNPNAMTQTAGSLIYVGANSTTFVLDGKVIAISMVKVGEQLLAFDGFGIDPLVATRIELLPIGHQPPLS